MAGTYGTPDYVPTSGPLDFERLFVAGKEVLPGGGQIGNVKAISIKPDTDAATVAKAFNNLLAELKIAGIMKDN